MWRIIAADERTWLYFKAYFQESHLYREEIEQTSLAAGYVIANNGTHGEMEYVFIKVVSATAA